MTSTEATIIRVTEEEALRFHSEGQPGKLAIAPTKSLATALDLSLAYSPGVAFPCLHIQKNPAAWRLRPDQKVVVKGEWETPAQRLTAAERLLGDLARLARAA